MGSRRKVAPATVASRPGGHILDDLAPLILDTAHVAEAGTIRAALDAVRLSPTVSASWERSRALGQQEIARHSNAAGRLAQRTAEHFARSRPAVDPVGDGAPF